MCKVVPRKFIMHPIFTRHFSWLYKNFVEYVHPLIKGIAVFLHLMFTMLDDTAYAMMKFRISLYFIQGNKAINREGWGHCIRWFQDFFSSNPCVYPFFKTLTLIPNSKTFPHMIVSHHLVNTFPEWDIISYQPQNIFLASNF